MQSIYFEVLGTNSTNETSYRFVARYDNVDDANWRAVRSLLNFKRAIVVRKTYSRRWIFFGKEIVKTSTVSRYAKPTF
jgi:hypothetical protein